MDKNQLAVSRHTEMADLMQTLADLQLKMSRVKKMFPKYHQHLQYTYNQILLHAKNKNLTPPWMAA